MNLVVAIVSASWRNVSLSAAPARSRNGVAASASLTATSPASTWARCTALTARAAAGEPAAHLHEAARVAGHQAARAGGLDVGELLVEDGRGHLGQPHRERAAEAAALVGARQLDQLHARARPRSSARGEADSSSPRSRWQESW